MFGIVGDDENNIKMRDLKRDILRDMHHFPVGLENYMDSDIFTKNLLFSHVISSTDIPQYIINKNTELNQNDQIQIDQSTKKDLRII